MSWYLSVLKQYANFSGRARCKEFWIFTLLSNVLILALYQLMCLFNDTALGGIFLILLAAYSLAVFIPALAVTIRRLHDTDRSGWFALLIFVPLASLVLLVFLCMTGTKGDNSYGADPKSA